jgi:RNA polymerase sigma-70 factor, ECF subfamily
LLDEIVDADGDPYKAIVARETNRARVLGRDQHLPPRQRAVLILRDVLCWKAREVATMLDSSVVAANSALQRARETLRERLPERRSEWPRSRRSSAEDGSFHFDPSGRRRAPT